MKLLLHFVSFVVLCCVAMAAADMDGEEMSGSASEPEEHVDEMKDLIQKIQDEGKYVILSHEEFQKLTSEQFIPKMANTPRTFEQSGGPRGVMRLLKTEKPSPRFQGHSQRSQFPTPEPHNKTGVTYVSPTQEVPKLPNFSGEDQKNDVNYDVWRYQLKCLVLENAVTESVLLQAIRKSLRGTAREILVSIGTTASVDDILNKLDTLFGNECSDEYIMQTFYSTSQKEGESVTAYGCRLENILQMAVQNGHISGNAKDDMLRSKFWTGLRSDKFKNQTRHKYDSIKSYDLLLKEIRAIDLEINPQVDKVKSSKGQQKSIQSDSDRSEIDKLSDKMKQMFNKMTKLESELKHYSNALGSTSVEQRGTDGGN